MLNIIRYVGDFLPFSLLGQALPSTEVAEKESSNESQGLGTRAGPNELPPDHQATVLVGLYGHGPKKRARAPTRRSVTSLALGKEVPLDRLQALPYSPSSETPDFLVVEAK